jgi:hypothetical protein
MRDMPVRRTHMRWPMGDTHLWERHVYERYAYEKDAYEMAYGRCMPMRWPMGDARL